VVGSLSAGGTNGAFFESQNEAQHHPEVVDAMVKAVLPWHHSTPIPFGALRNTAADKRFQPPGCEAYPFPGTAEAPGPDDEVLLVHSNVAGGDAADAAVYARNLALHTGGGSVGGGDAALDSPLATPEALAKHHAMQGGMAEPPPHVQEDESAPSQAARVAELEAEVAALKAELAQLKPA
jgi:hypothetical protein